MILEQYVKQQTAEYARMGLIDAKEGYEAFAETVVLVWSARIQADQAGERAVHQARWHARRNDRCFLSLPMRSLRTLQGEARMSNIRQVQWNTEIPERLDLSRKKKARARVRDPGLALRDAERERISALKAAAIAAGCSTFDSGTPCNAGHLAPRFVHDGKCVECNRISCAERYEKRVGPERRAELDMLRAEQAARKEKRLASAALFQEAGQARRKARASGAVTYFSRKP